jgi:hypothetical protein
VVVLLAFAESKTVSTTTLGLDFPTVWDQTSPRLGFDDFSHSLSFLVQYNNFVHPKRGGRETVV